MKNKNIAYFGAKPLFAKPLPVGQLYFPSWQRYELAFKDIFDRQYYTNHGKLAQELETRLQKFFGVRHVICVSNATIGLMMVAEGLALTGKVILPSFTFIASAQSLTWSGLKPVFCDIDIDSHQISIDHLISFIDPDVSAIMGVNLWGGACNVKKLTHIAEHREIHLYFDSAHAFGCIVNDERIGNFGIAEVFSFHATKILNATEGGCICTNDDGLAERLRNIRSSYGIRKPVKVVKTSNGRMSEAQAAIALLSLEDFSKNQKHNEQLYLRYQDQLAEIPGIYLIIPHGVSFSNYQYVVLIIDEQEYGINRNLLIDLLKSENIIARRYFYPGIHRIVTYKNEMHSNYQLPNTDIVSSSCLQLPVGALVSHEDVDRICTFLKIVHELSPLIKS